MSTLLEFIKTQEEAFRSPSRLASLYSDFQQQRKSNPEGYNANSQAWLTALIDAARVGKFPGQTDGFIIPTGEVLGRALQTPQYGRPLALPAVIEDAISQSRFIPVTDFVAARASIYSKSWITSPWSLIDWALTRIGSPVRARSGLGKHKNALVVISNLEHIADTLEANVAKILTSDVSRTFSSELFIDTFAPIVGRMSPRSTSFDILITYLERDRKCLVYESASGTIKFKPDDGRPLTTISREDIDIASLRSLIFNLDRQVANLEQKVTALENKVRAAITSKNIPSAKRSLRLKKSAETTLEQRHATLDQLQDVYTKIEQAASQVEIVKVMQAAGRTLKTLNTKAGDVDDIRDIMEGLRESMADTEEISNAINADPSTVVDENELEDELKALEEEESNRVAAHQEQQSNAQLEDDAERTRKRLENLAVPLDNTGQGDAQSQDRVAASTERQPTAQKQHE